MTIPHRTNTERASSGPASVLHESDAFRARPRHPSADRAGFGDLPELDRAAPRTPTPAVALAAPGAAFGDLPVLGRPTPPPRLRTYPSVQLPALRGKAPPPPPPPPVDDLDFCGTGETVVMELDALASGQAGLGDEPPRARAGSANGVESRSVRFTPPSMAALRPPETTPSAERRPPSSPSRRLLAAAEDSGKRVVTPAEEAARAVPHAEPPSGPRAPSVAADLASASQDAKRPGIFAFAGFGLPPAKLEETPAYALRVMARRRVLRAGLASARARRSADVAIYEAALEAADARAIARGRAILIGIAVLALLSLAAFALALS